MDVSDMEETGNKMISIFFAYVLAIRGYLLWKEEI